MCEGKVVDWAHMAVAPDQMLDHFRKYGSNKKKLENKLVLTLKNNDILYSKLHRLIPYFGDIALAFWGGKF